MTITAITTTKLLSCLWVDKRDHDVSGSLGNGHALMEVGQTTGVH